MIRDLNSTLFSNKKAIPGGFLAKKHASFFEQLSDVIRTTSVDKRSVLLSIITRASGIAKIFYRGWLAYVFDLVDAHINDPIKAKVISSILSHDSGLARIGNREWLALVFHLVDVHVNDPIKASLLSSIITHCSGLARIGNAGWLAFVFKLVDDNDNTPDQASVINKILSCNSGIAGVGDAVWLKSIFDITDSDRKLTILSSLLHCTFFSRIGNNSFLRNVKRVLAVANDHNLELYGKVIQSKNMTHFENEVWVVNVCMFLNGINTNNKIICENLTRKQKDNTDGRKRFFKSDFLPALTALFEIVESSPPDKISFIGRLVNSVVLDIHWVYLIDELYADYESRKEVTMTKIRNGGYNARHLELQIP